MPAYPFLSDEWIDAARALRAEIGDSVEVTDDVLSDLRINLVIEDVPFGSGVVDAHLNTSSGGIDVETGHLDDPQATVTLGYDTAHAMIIDQEPQAIMQAFLTGRIAIDGDVTRLLLLAAQPPSPEADGLAERVRDITA